MTATDASATTTDDDLLTTAEVAVICRTNDSTVRYWRMTGFGPPGIRVGRKVLYRRGDLSAWIRALIDAQNQ